MSVATKPDQIKAARTAAGHVATTHQALVEFLQAGQTLADIDAFVGRTLTSLQCSSAFLRYRIPGQRPFPSHSCLSLNDCVVHGTHLYETRPIEPGDILSIDIGVTHRGWIGDAAWTYAIEHCSDAALRLMAVGKESLRRGIEAIVPGRPLLDWARAVQQCVETEAGMGLVRGLGGHGYGRTLHAPPFVSNVVPTTQGEWPDAFNVFAPGMLLALEPMLALGSPEIRSKGGQWPIFIADGSLAAHYEADVLVTEDGHENLTAAMFDLPDIVG